jgi:hypothetical protein
MRIETTTGWMRMAPEPRGIMVDLRLWGLVVMVLAMPAAAQSSGL